MKKICFKDEQQDLMWVLIDESGLIVDCNLQEFVWVGFKVNLDLLIVGSTIFMTDKENVMNEYDFVVEKIEELQKNA